MRFSLVFLVLLSAGCTATTGTVTLDIPAGGNASAIVGTSLTPTEPDHEATFRIHYEITPVAHEDEGGGVHATLEMGDVSIDAAEHIFGADDELTGDLRAGDLDGSCSVGETCLTTARVIFESLGDASSAVTLYASITMEDGDAEIEVVISEQ